MRLRLPRPDSPAADPSALPRTIIAQPSVTPMAADDPHRPAHWAVPRGVRTASEWAWRALVIGAAVVAALDPVCSPLSSGRAAGRPAEWATEMQVTARLGFQHTGLGQR